MVLSHPWDMELFSFNSSEQPEFNSSFENPSSRYPIDLSRIVIHGIADHIFSVVLEGHHEVGKHPVYLPAPGIITFMARNEKYFRSSVVMADHPFAVIPED